MQKRDRIFREERRKEPCFWQTCDQKGKWCDTQIQSEESDQF